LAALVATVVETLGHLRKVMIEKRKMLRCWMIRTLARAMSHLFCFAYPRGAFQGLDRSLQGLVFDGFSPFPGAHARDPLRGTAR
jgi:hypothetical protein